MKSVSGKELARLLERCGWMLLRVNGSHHIYGKSGSVIRLSADTRQPSAQNWIVASFA